MSVRLSLPSVSDARESVGQLADKLSEVRQDLSRMASGDGVLDGLKPVLRSQRSRTIVGLGGLSLFLVGSAIGFALRRKPKEVTFLEKGRRIGRAVVRVVEDPDRIASSGPSIGRDVLAVACSVVAATLTRNLIDRAF